MPSAKPLACWTDVPANICTVLMVSNENGNNTHSDRLDKTQTRNKLNKQLSILEVHTFLVFNYCSSNKIFQMTQADSRVSVLWLKIRLMSKFV